MNHRRKMCPELIEVFNASAAEDALDPMDPHLDLGGEMRRIAAFLDLDVPDGARSAVVDRCRIDEMRTAAAASGRLEMAFEGGADSFFNQGTNGRWVGALTDGQIERYLADVADGLPADAAEWLEHGSLHLGVRPGSGTLGSSLLGE